jgi:hypothetical protein
MSLSPASSPTTSGALGTAARIDSVSVRIPSDCAQTPRRTCRRSDLAGRSGSYLQTGVCYVDEDKRRFELGQSSIRDLSGVERSRIKVRQLGFGGVLRLQVNRVRERSQFL